MFFPFVAICLMATTLTEAQILYQYEYSPLMMSHQYNNVCGKGVFKMYFKSYCNSQHKIRIQSSACQNVGVHCTSASTNDKIDKKQRSNCESVKQECNQVVQNPKLFFERTNKFSNEEVEENEKQMINEVLPTVKSSVVTPNSVKVLTAIQTPTPVIVETTTQAPTPVIVKTTTQTSTPAIVKTAMQTSTPITVPAMIQTPAPITAPTVRQTQAPLKVPLTGEAQLNEKVEILLRICKNIDLNCPSKITHEKQIPYCEFIKQECDKIAVTPKPLVKETKKKEVEEYEKQVIEVDEPPPKIISVTLAAVPATTQTPAPATTQTLKQVKSVNAIPTPDPIKSTINNMNNAVTSTQNRINYNKLNQSEEEKNNGTLPLNIGNFDYEKNTKENRKESNIKLNLPNKQILIYFPSRYFHLSSLKTVHSNIRSQNSMTVIPWSQQIPRIITPQYPMIKSDPTVLNNQKFFFMNPSNYQSVNLCQTGIQSQNCQSPCISSTMLCNYRPISMLTSSIPTEFKSSK